MCQAWKAIWAACDAHGITLLGHVSDGDSRLRAAGLSLCLKKQSLCRVEGLTLDHPLIELIMPKVCWHCKEQLCVHYEVCAVSKSSFYCLRVGSFISSRLHNFTKCYIALYYLCVCNCRGAPGRCSMPS